jgi:fatty-acyl-CoA synthase
VPVLGSYSLLSDFSGIVRDTDSIAIVHGPEAQPLLGPWTAELGVRTLVAADSATGNLQLASLFDADPLPGRPRAPGQHSGIIFTAGTTGRPKPILRTFETDLWDGIQKLMIYRMGFHDVYMYRSPLNLTALLGPTRQLFLAGATYLILDGFEAQRVAEISARERVSQLSMQSGQWAQILELPGIDGYDFSALRQIAVSASQVPVALKERIYQRFGRLPFLQVYGMSESGFVSAVQDGDEKADLSGYVGRPLQVNQVRIAGENGEDLPPGEIGEVVVKGPSVAPGYYKRPEATATAFVDGWVFTGDLGKLDEEGGLYLIDRLSDVFSVDGRRIYPGLVQEALFALPSVSEGAFVGVPKDGGVQPVAFVVPRRGLEVDPENVRSTVAGAVQYLAPESFGIAILATLPRTPAGKVDKGALAARWLAEQ